VLEQLRLQNFQRHGSLKIDLDPRITTIVGPTDSGKSSVLRSVRWLCMNRPSGDGFVRYGENNCRVGLSVDGEKIVRSKTPSKNEMKALGQIYRAFGIKVPEAVENLLRLSSDNFQTQHEPVFWFCLTAGEVAKRLNAIVDLELIDECHSNLGKMLRKETAEKEATAARLEQARKEKASLLFVVLADKQLKRIEEQIETMAVSKARASRLGQLLEDGEKYREEIARATDDVLGASRACSRVVATVAAWKKLEKGVERLDQLVRDIEGKTSSVSEYDNKIREAEDVLENELGGKCPLCGGDWK